MFIVEVGMNQRILKFLIELQTPEMEEDKPEYINFRNNGGGKKFFEVSKFAKVTVPVVKE